MKILAIIGFQPYWGSQPPDILDKEDGPTVGGGEENALEICAGLADLGHRVDAYWCGLPGWWSQSRSRALTKDPFHGGISFQNSPWDRGCQFHGNYENWHEPIVRGDYDVILSWSALWPLEAAPKDKPRLFIQQLNDLMLPGDWGVVDCVVSPSQSHSDDLIKRQLGWEGGRGVVHNGIRPERYQNQKPWHEREMLVGYWNSPDRGLHHVLRAWPHIRKAIPEARLHVFYEIKKYLAIVAASPIGYYGDRGAMVRDAVMESIADKSIVFRGQVTRHELSKFQTSARVHCFPLDPFAYTEGFCHPAGTMIATIEGLKPIDRLTLSDCALAGSGLWRPITRISSRRYEGRFYRVKPACGESVEFTHDHPVFASTEEVPTKGGFGWIEAKNLRPGMWLYTSPPRESVAPQTIQLPARWLRHGSSVNGVRGTGQLGGKEPIVLPDALPLTKDLCRIIGYFAGDGNAPRRGRTASSLSFFLGSEQKAENVGDIQACLLEVFGLPSTVKDNRPAKKMFSIRAQSSSVSHVFSSWCYADDGRKRLPPWVMRLPAEYAAEVLKGLWRTDGSIAHHDNGSRFAGFTSSSPYLIGQTRMLLARLGHRTKINRRYHHTGQISYGVWFSIAGDFLDYGGRDVRGKPGKAHAVLLSDGASALKIREIDETPVNETVFSLTVDSDETYHVGNFVVHNCTSAAQGLAAGCLELLTPKDALPSLYGDAPLWITKNTIDADFSDHVADLVINGLRGEIGQENIARGPAKAAGYTWAAATQQMEDLCQRLIVEKKAKVAA